VNEIKKQYLAFAAGEFRVPSRFDLFLPAWAPSPELEDALETLRSHDFVSIETETSPIDEAWSLRFEGGSLTLLASEDVSEFHIRPGSLADDTLEAMRASCESLRLEVTLQEPVLDTFHGCLKLLSALAPEAVGLIDCGACRSHTGEWLRSAASSNIPPPPTSLFTIHAVQGDATWLHTHGLLRCGSIELEMLDIPKECAGDLGTLLNTAATMFLEQGVCPPEHPFEVGQGLELLWTPWQMAISDLDPGSLGSASDRENCHDHPSGVLSAPKKRRFGLFGQRMQTPAVYREILADNPLLYHSQLETQRMSLLAKDRFQQLRRIEIRFRDADDWDILIKLGYQVDGDPEQHEHLWFRVHGIDGALIDATLLNQPYGIARMNEGDRAKHPLDPISDWRIHSPFGDFRPDNIHELLAALPE